MCATSHWLPCDADERTYGQMDGHETIASLPTFIGLIDIDFFIHGVSRRGFDAQSSVKKVRHNEGKRNELRIPSLVFR